MALRIDTAIIRGVIDSTQRGQVTGRLWLLDRPDPIDLKLRGDPWRDVAGTLLTFENPVPQAQADAMLLLPLQEGVVGDITASRKVRIIDVPENEWLSALKEERLHEMPSEWSNSLYIEWFTEEQGRIVVETADFMISTSSQEWQMDEAEEQAQLMANQQAMRSYVADSVHRNETDPEDLPENMTEEDWERQLQESDRVSEAHMEALEKYGEDDDAEEKTAFVMGWDHMLDFMAARENGPSDEGIYSEDENPDQWLAEEESEDTSHPLLQRSQNLVSLVMDALQKSGLSQLQMVGKDHPLEKFVALTLQIHGKLSGALGFPNTSPDLDPAYILAILKRCLNWSNLALATLNELSERNEFSRTQVRVFESFQKEFFALREEITDLRRELRNP